MFKSNRFIFQNTGPSEVHGDIIYAADFKSPKPLFEETGRMTGNELDPIARDAYIPDLDTIKHDIVTAAERAGEDPHSAIVQQRVLDTKIAEWKAYDNIRFIQTNFPTSDVHPVRENMPFTDIFEYPLVRKSLFLAPDDDAKGLFPALSNIQLQKGDVVVIGLAGDTIKIVHLENPTEITPGEVIVLNEATRSSEGLNPMATLDRLRTKRAAALKAAEIAKTYEMQMVDEYIVLQQDMLKADGNDKNPAEIAKLMQYERKRLGEIESKYTESRSEIVKAYDNRQKALEVALQLSDLDQVSEAIEEM